MLEAALQLFSTRGYRATSVRDIAALAGLSTGNVYHHFPDKETIFRTLLDQYWAAIDSPDFPFNQALERRLAQAERLPDEWLRASAAFSPRWKTSTCGATLAASPARP